MRHPRPYLVICGLACILCQLAARAQPADLPASTRKALAAAQERAQDEFLCRYDPGLSPAQVERLVAFYRNSFASVENLATLHTLVCRQRIQREEVKRRNAAAVDRVLTAAKGAKTGGIGEG